MNLEKYPLKSDQLQLTFEFESIGPQGKVRKMIQYNESEILHFFHLGFGDLNPETGEVDDLAVTNNGDTLNILATVAMPKAHGHTKTHGQLGSPSPIEPFPISSVLYLYKSSSYGIKNVFLCFVLGFLGVFF